MNLNRVLIQFGLFIFLSFNIALVLTLITPAENPRVLTKLVGRNLVFIILTVLGLSLFGLILRLIF